MRQPLVGVVIGSRSEFNVMRRGLETMRVMGVPYEFVLISPYRAPEKLAEFARVAKSRGLEILIAGGGGAAAVAPILAAHSDLPIIGVPIDASPLRGQDALHSMVMTPPGSPVATVGINNSENAAILAAQILSLKYPVFSTILEQRRASAIQRADFTLGELRKEYPDLCEPARTAPPVGEAASETETDPGPLSDPRAAGLLNEMNRIRPGAKLEGQPEPQAPAEPYTRPKTPTRESEDDTPTPLSLDPPPASPRSSGAVLRAKLENLDDSTQPVAPKKPPVSEATTDEPAPIPQDTTEREFPVEIEEEPVETKIFTVNREYPSDDLMDHAMMVLMEGGLVALPTDTVYGLAADATNREAVERLHHLKKQDHQKTMGVLIPSAEMLEQLVREIPPPLEPVLEKFWPGALTVVLPKSPGMLAGGSGADRIGVRVPADKVCLAVMERIGRPLAVRSAGLNRGGVVTDPVELVTEFRGHVDCILDGGICNSPGASTVLSVNGDRFEILREGAVTRAELAELLGDRLNDA